MSNLVIVAIPEEDDRVWKVSSEKVPHLTLLFLGDDSRVSNLQQIIEFVEHAASTTLKQFHLTVDRRDELGNDKADVLFFKKHGYEAKAIRDFRTVLLKEPNIKSAHDATSQFETPEEVGAPGQPWVPHLTLGYPTSPAKSVPDDQISSFYGVSFNKIAVWPGDFEGPEFLLKDYWNEIDEMSIPMDVAMSDISHHGVKGQKWGVRKTADGGHIRINTKTNRAGISKSSTAALLVPALLMPPLTPLAFLSPRVRSEVKAARAHNQGVNADKKWQKQLTSSKNAVKVHNTAAVEINQKLPGFNSDKRWKDKDGKDIDLLSNPTKQKEYDRAFEDEVMNPAYSNAAIKVHGSTSPGGRYKFEIHDASTGVMTVRDTLEEAKHAATDNEMSAQFKILRDAIGHIVGLDPEENDTVMTQTADLGAEFLAHYGVKGMHWGQRKAPPMAVTPTARSVVPQGAKRKTKVETEGGENHPASDDAIKVAMAKAKLKKSGTSALTNKELQDVANRVELEARVKRAVQPAGQKFVSNLLKTQGQNEINTRFNADRQRRFQPPKSKAA